MRAHAWGRAAHVLDGGGAPVLAPVLLIRGRAVPRQSGPAPLTMPRLHLPDLVSSHESRFTPPHTVLAAPSCCLRLAAAVTGLTDAAGYVVAVARGARSECRMVNVIRRMLVF